MQRKIGVIGPSWTEIGAFIEQLEQARITEAAMLSFHEGTAFGLQVVAVECGICKVNAAIAAQILIDRFAVSEIVVVGVSGAIDRTLKIGDTVIATECCYHDVAQNILTEDHPHMSSVWFPAGEKLLQACRSAADSGTFFQQVLFGRMVTGEAFIDQEGRADIIEHFDPLCVDMETASVAHVCYVNGIPYAAIRSITDTEDESGLGSFHDNFEHASACSIAFLRELLQAAADQQA